MISIVAHVATQRTRLNVTPDPGERCLFRHDQTGCGHACVVVGVVARTGSVLISYPTASGRYTDGTRRLGWTKPRSVPLKDLYHPRPPSDLRDLDQFVEQHGRCPHLPEAAP